MEAYNIGYVNVNLRTSHIQYDNPVFKKKNGKNWCEFFIEPFKSHFINYIQKNPHRLAPLEHKISR